VTLVILKILNLVYAKNVTINVFHALDMEQTVKSVLEIDLFPQIVFVPIISTMKKDKLSVKNVMMFV